MVFFGPLGTLPLLSLNASGGGVDGSGNLTGVQANAAAGSFAKIVTVAAQGVSASGSAGVVKGSVFGFFSGVQASAAAGSIGPSYRISINGVQADGSAGTIRDHVFAFVPGVSAAAVAGSFAVDEKRGVNGAQATGYAGTFTTWVRAFFQGASVTGFAGDFTGNPAGNFSGVEGTGYAGNITIAVSGGGTSSATGDGDRPRRRKRTALPGFDQIKKQPDRKVHVETNPSLPPPDFSGDGVLVTEIETPPQGDAFSAGGLMAMRENIITAQDLADINRLLDGMAMDDQDMADILDVLQLID